jgi:hypothetical protein
MTRPDVGLQPWINRTGRSASRPLTTRSGIFLLRIELEKPRSMPDGPLMQSLRLDVLRRVQFAVKAWPASCAADRHKAGEASSKQCDTRRETDLDCLSRERDRQRLGGSCITMKKGLQVGNQIDGGCPAVRRPLA